MRKSVRGLREGEIFSLETGEGCGYFQYLFTDEKYGSCIRLLPGIYTKEVDMAELVLQKEITTTFFPLNIALRRKIVSRVGHYPIPEHVRIPPLMRVGGLIGEDGRVSCWWLRDGEREERLGKDLTTEQMAIPVLGIANDGALIEKFKGTWKDLQ